MPQGHDNNLRAADPRLLPGARALPEAELTPEALDRPAASPTGPVVASCAEGHGRGQGLAALLRSRGIAAEYVHAWRAARLPLVDPGRITARDAQGHSLRVTRPRPKVDRIACPWLIRRFFDPRAVFLFVAPAEVATAAAHNWPTNRPGAAK